MNQIQQDLTIFLINRILKYEFFLAVLQDYKKYFLFPDINNMTKQNETMINDKNGGQIVITNSKLSDIDTTETA